MAKKIRTETIEIAPNIIGNIKDDGTYFVFDKVNNILLNPENIDDKIIYFGLGGHPAFNCDYSNGEYEIVFSENGEGVSTYPTYVTL